MKALTVTMSMTFSVEDDYEHGGTEFVEIGVLDTVVLVGQAADEPRLIPVGELVAFCTIGVECERCE